MKRLIKDIQIRHKIILMPIVACVTLLAILSMIILFNLQNAALTKKIQTHYYPLQELSHDLEKMLANIQRGMQDAVATSDSSALLQISEQSYALLASLENKMQVFPQEAQTFSELKKDFENYFRLARETTMRMISEETSESLVVDLTKMTAQYNRINRQLRTHTERYAAEIRHAFKMDRNNLDNSLSLIISMMISGVLAMGWISYKLTHSITSPLKEVVSVAHRVAKGDFDVQIALDSMDEIGQLKKAFLSMITRITHLIQEKDEAYDEIFKSRELHQKNVIELTQLNKTLSQEISERKKAETELNEYKYHLEELVDERTIELQSMNAMLQKEINSRKEIEKALRLNERKYFMLFNQIPDPIFISDKETKHFLDCNKMVHKIYGYSIDELRTKTSFDLYPAKEKQSVLENVGHKRNSPNQTFTHITKSGRRFDVEVIVDEIEYQGRPAYLSIARDISERMLAEAKKNELLLELQSVNQELKEFAYVVSHDLKAPLRAIGSLSEWLLVDYGNELDEEGKELVNLLDSRVKRMHKLIEGILQYSRVGRVREEVVEVDLNDSLADIIDSLSPPENIIITVDPDLPVVYFEKTRIEQVFQNLLSNAIKYMDKDEGKITVTKAEDDDFYQFCVTDNGPGIDARHHEKIFQIFQTLNPRDEFESTGVGLTLIKKIIKMYNGQIWLESEPGEGTSFYFTVPMGKISLGKGLLQELETGAVHEVS